MTLKMPLTRKVENDSGNAVTIVPQRNGTADIEVGSDTAYVRLSFSDPNALRALAGHLLAVADEVQQQRQEVVDGDNLISY